MQNILTALAPVFYLLVLPLGVAGQNIGMGVALACCLAVIKLDGTQSVKKALKSQLLRQMTLLWFLLIASVTLSTFLADEHKEATRFFWGYSYGFLIPVVGVLFASAENGQWQWAERTLRFVLILMGVVAVSQMAWPWKFEGGRFIETIHRSQGFYSHPLTFAYVAIVIMPWAIAQNMNQIKRWDAWLVCLSVMAIVLCSQSVTVIAITLIVGLIAIFVLLNGRTRLLILMLSGLIAIGVLTTKNSVSNKIYNVLSGERGDHETNYPDDRMAFWHAHWEMFKDAPLLGHGTGLEVEDRAPYYAKIGLPAIKRKYEAHNMYLEYAVEGGVVAVLAIVGVLVWLVRVAWSAKGIARWEKFYMVATPIVFAVGGLTQNSIQDSEVRFVFLGFIAVMLNRVIATNSERTTRQA